MIAVAMSVALASCMDDDKVKVTGIEDVQMIGLSRVDIVLKTENMSNRSFVVKSADLRIGQYGEDLLDVILTKEVELPRRSIGRVTVPLGLKLIAANPFLLMQLGSIDWENELPDFTVTGDIVVKSGFIRKKIKLKDVPLSEIITIFDSRYIQTVAR